MVWFKVDDTLAMHAKVLTAGNAAMGLWVRCGSWSMQQLTDGFIPEHIARAFGNTRESNALVSVGLWHAADGGFMFHDWPEFQRSREQVESDRHAAAERQRNARERAKSRRESRGDNGVSHGPPDQTRPDQTSNTTSADADVPATSAAKPKRATQRPADFRPSQGHIDLAAELGIDLRAEWQQFCDHHDAKGSTYKDWPAALRTWIRNAAKFGRSRPASGTPRQQADADMFARQMARAEAREAAARGEIA